MWGIELLKSDEVSQQIVIAQRELNELIENNGDRDPEKVLEKSRMIDKLIVTFYNLKKDDNNA